MTDELTTRRGRGRPAGGDATTRATRASLIESAYEAFSENGYNGASMRDVARRGGVSLTALMHHFPRKSDLLVAVLDKRDSSFAIDPNTPPPIEELFADMVRGARRNEQIEGLVRLYTVLAAESWDVDHPAHQYFVHRRAEFTQFLSTGIRRGQAEGELAQNTDPDELAIAIVALWDGLQVNAPYNPQISIPRQLKAFFEAILGHELDV